MDISILRALLDIGFAGLMAVAIWGGWKKWYVWWWVYEAKAKEAEEWKAIALRSLNATEASVNVAERVTRRKVSEEVADGYENRA